MDPQSERLPESDKAALKTSVQRSDETVVVQNQLPAAQSNGVRDSQITQSSASSSGALNVHASSPSTASTEKFNWHIPSPQKADQIRKALSMSNGAANKITPVPNIPVPSDNPQSTAPSDAAISISGSKSVAATTGISGELITASSPVKPAPVASHYADSSSSSSSSDSSDDSSSDEDETAVRTKPSGKLVLNLAGGSLPKQLMMRCRVRLERVNLQLESTIQDPATSSSQSPFNTSTDSVEPMESDTSFDFSSYRPQTINTRKESRARPLSKIKSAKSKNVALLSPLAKVKSVRSVEQSKGLPDVIDMLRGCNGCKVRLIDCWRGIPLPYYVKASLEQSYVLTDSETIHHKSVKKKKKKEKHKEAKAQDHVVELPSRTKPKKLKTKRVIVNDSSDEELASQRKSSKWDEDPDIESHRLNRQDKVKQLAEKKSGLKSANDVQTKKEPAPKSKTPKFAQSYVSPWSEAVATAGMPKIPKIKKHAPGSYVPASQQQMDANFRHIDTPFARLQKREARRREFEKHAAMKYGGQTAPVNPYAAVPRNPNKPAHPHATMPAPGSVPYQIPRPPIPGQMEISLVKGPPPVPPPLDPRATQQPPELSCVPPTPVIPKSEPHFRLQPGSLHIQPHSTLPDASALFSEPDSLLPDPAATAQLETGVPTLSRSSSSLSTVSKVSTPLLPNPDSLLPTPESLLPAPDALLPEPKGLLPLPHPVFNPSSSELLATQQRHEQFRDNLDEEDWKIISQPEAPINKLKTSEHGQPLDDWSDSKPEEPRTNVDSGDRHQKMAADSTSNDDPPVNQDVLDEICRLSLEISKRIAKKTSDENQSPAIIPLEPEISETRNIPREIPLDEPDIVCYDYGHTRPPLPAEDVPAPPRTPSPPPPSLAPPPVPPVFQSRVVEPFVADYGHDSYDFENSTEGYGESGHDYVETNQTYEDTTEVYDESNQAYDDSTQGYGESSQSYEESAQGSSRGYDQSAQGYVEPSQSYDESAQGYDESAQGYDESGQGYDESAQGYDESAQGYDESAARGYDDSAQVYNEPYTSTSKNYAEERHDRGKLRPILSRHFEDSAVVEESYEDILAYEQERTRRELYYKDLRQSALKCDSHRESFRQSYRADDDYERRDSHYRREERERRDRRYDEQEQDAYYVDQRRRQRARDDLETSRAPASSTTITRDRYGLPIMSSDDEDASPTYPSTEGVNHNIAATQQAPTTDHLHADYVQHNVESKATFVETENSKEQSQPELTNEASADLIVEDCEPVSYDCQQPETVPFSHSPDIIGEAPMDLDSEDSEDIDVDVVTVDIPNLNSLKTTIISDSSAQQATPAHMPDTGSTLSEIPVPEINVVSTESSGNVGQSAVIDRPTEILSTASSIAETILSSANVEGSYRLPAMPLPPLPPLASLSRFNANHPVSMSMSKTNLGIDTEPSTSTLQTQNSHVGLVAIPLPSHLTSIALSNVATATTLAVGEKSTTSELVETNISLDPMPQSSFTTSLITSPGPGVCTIPPEEITREHRASPVKACATNAPQTVSTVSPLCHDGLLLETTPNSSPAVSFPPSPESYTPTFTNTGDASDVMPLPLSNFVPDLVQDDKDSIIYKALPNTSCSPLSVKILQASTPVTSTEITRIDKQTDSKEEKRETTVASPIALELISSQSRVKTPELPSNLDLEVKPKVSAPRAVLVQSALDNVATTTKSINLPTKTKSLTPIGIASVFRSQALGNEAVVPNSINVSTEEKDLTNEATKESDGLTPDDKSRVVVEQDGSSILSQISATLLAINSIVARGTTDNQQNPQVNVMATKSRSTRQTERKKPSPSHKSKHTLKKHKEKYHSSGKSSRHSKRHSVDRKKLEHEIRKKLAKSEFFRSHVRKSVGKDGLCTIGHPVTEKSQSTTIKASSEMLHAHCSAKLKGDDEISVKSKTAQQSLAIQDLPLNHVNRCKAEESEVDSIPVVQLSSSDPFDKSTLSPKVTKSLPSVNEIGTLEGDKIDSSCYLDDLPVEALQDRLSYLHDLVQAKSSKPPLYVTDPCAGANPTAVEQPGSITMTSEESHHRQPEESHHRQPAVAEVETALPSSLESAAITTEADTDQPPTTESLNEPANDDVASISPSLESEQRKMEEEETASFFGMVASGSVHHEPADDFSAGIPGLTVLDECMTTEWYEATVGVPRHKYPLSIPELNEELADLIRCILTNTSSCTVLKALVRICILRKTEKFTFDILKTRNPEITDLSSIYNKALINLLSHDDLFRLVTAAGIIQWLPELEIHPTVRELLLDVHTRMQANV